MAGNKGKSKGGSGSANDKRGGIAKAKESARRGSNDSAGGSEPRLDTAPLAPKSSTTKA